MWNQRYINDLISLDYIRLVQLKKLEIDSILNGQMKKEQLVKGVTKGCGIAFLDGLPCEYIYIYIYGRKMKRNICSQIYTTSTFHSNELFK